jgi:hypothetical protein
MNDSQSFFTGICGDYSWLVSGREFASLPDLVRQHHLGSRLCISSFDSGPLTPSDDETRIGWTLSGKLMISPPLTESLEIPYDQYDEWWIFESEPHLGDDLEVFINYGMFTLVHPEVTYRSFDPTWEKRGLDYLVPIQERFWQQIERLNPVSYVGMGNNDVVVSRNHSFVEAATNAAAIQPR